MAKCHRSPAMRPVPKPAAEPPAQPALWDPTAAVEAVDHTADSGAGSVENGPARAVTSHSSDDAPQRPTRVSPPSTTAKRTARPGTAHRQVLLREQAELLDRVAERRGELDAALESVETARRAWLDAVKTARSRHVIMDYIADASGVTRAAVYQNLEREQPTRNR
ncbi:hypothetical protein [Candidatus Poriferisodalis sp.]|uniref:hypothetical protein n=1 Tax=Candidatus Poriferisodalis sp. TaxID=3101277 RepID=UPI003B01C881